MLPSALKRSLLDFGAQLLRSAFRRSLEPTPAARTAAVDGINIANQPHMAPHRRGNTGFEQLDRGFFSPSEEYYLRGPRSSASQQTLNHFRALPPARTPQTPFKSQEQVRGSSYSNSDGDHYTESRPQRSSHHPAPFDRYRQDESSEQQAYIDASTGQGQLWRRGYGFFDSPQPPQQSSSRQYQPTRQERLQPEMCQTQGTYCQPQGHHPQGFQSQGYEPAEPLRRRYSRFGHGWPSKEFVRESFPVRPQMPGYRTSAQTLVAAQTIPDEPSQQPLRSIDHPTRTTDSPNRPVSMRRGPRSSYFRLTKAAPALFPVTSGPPPSSPLLILDLNGTLLCRGRNGTNGQNPTRRPYLSSFLQYCLDVKDPSFQAVEGGIPHSSAADIDAAAASCRRKQWVSAQADLRSGECDKPRGLHFQAKDSEIFGENSAPSAAQRLLVWSSARPKNVDAMVRSILHPIQAAQLVRVWARDTLVPERLFAYSSPSTKDLEIVWNALNHNAAFQAMPCGQQTHEGELRVDATYRDAADHADPDTSDPDSKSEGEEGMYYAWQKKHRSAAPPQRKKQRLRASRLAAAASDRFVLKPQLSASRTWKTAGRGFGLHNTLLLDDSTDKARMQPYNHLLVPEFDEGRASATRTYRERLATTQRHDTEAGKEPKQKKSKQLHAMAAKGVPQSSSYAPAAAAAAAAAAQDSSPNILVEAAETPSASSRLREQVDMENLGPAPDTVLLQAVGVLEHARWQVNVASWIRHGGLGSFAGMKQPGVSVEVGEDQGNVLSNLPRQEIKASRRQKRRRHRVRNEEKAQEQGQEGKEEIFPRLHAKTAEKTEEFWLIEGKNALRRRGVPIIF